jgi:pyroglutamyl-peptidase
MRILVQGFGPFGRFPINPSELLVRALDGHRADLGAAADAELRTEVLETTAPRVAEAVPALMAGYRPDVWLGVGLAAGRTSLSLEAVAANLGYYQDEDPDAAAKPEPRHPVSADGPAAYLTGLPAEEILGAWRDAEIPGYLSQSAGTYLCNMSFYLAAQAAQRLGTGCMVGFLHVPLLPEQVTKPATEPSMPFPLQQAGLDVVLDVCRASGRTGGPISTGRTG